ncbi:EamA family transporter [bacterium]|nr:EamA family transporter [candidate division CSSED10-310 bacterium]
MKYFFALGLALLLNATANLLMKFGMKRIAESGGLFQHGATAGLWSIVTSPVLVAGMICFGLNLGAYMYALQNLPISVAYPVMVTVGFAIIVIVAGIWLGERLNLLQWAGVGAILLGVWMVASQVRT